MSRGPLVQLQRRVLRRRRGAALIAVLTLLTLSGQASAQTSDDGSAVDEYVEEVPTSGGSTPVGGTEPTRKPLPTGVSSQLKSEAGEDAEALEEAATSSGFGAPQEKLRKRTGRKDESVGETATRPVRDVEPAEEGAVAAAASAATGGNGTPMIGLLIALAVISGAGLAIAAVRQARASR